MVKWIKYEYIAGYWPFSVCFFTPPPQVIKYKLCRCSDKKHKHNNNNNDQGTVLSVDDVKCHVGNFH